MNTSNISDTKIKVIQVKTADLPLSCPLPDAPVWNMHPKVYLPIENAPQGRVSCPYCGAEYQLIKD